MDTTERPTKIRKLSHGEDSEPVTVPTPPSNHVEANPNDPTTAPAAANTTSDTQPAQPLSKNQLKKLRKQQEWEAGKAERKAWLKSKDAEKKARKREAKRKAAEELAAQGLDATTTATTTPHHPPYQRHVCLPITFLIDCGFDDKMAEKERNSLGSQLTRCYSDNHKAPFQAHLLVCSWGGHLRERFDTALGKVYVRWKGMRFLEEDVVAAAEVARQSMARHGAGRLKGVFEKYAEKRVMSKMSKTANGAARDVGTTEPTEATSASVTNSTAQSTTEPSEPTTLTTTLPPTSTPASAPTPSIIPPTHDLDTLKSAGETVYLTSDSPHTLTELHPYSTYIVGGLVDKNREKGLCYKLARERGIKTAKLPIGEYMDMQSRFVLATNHVVEIMVRWLECGDWGEAFLKVIPKRKGGRLKGDDGNGYGEGGEKGETEGVEDDGDNDGDDHDENGGTPIEPDEEDGRR